MGAQAAFAASSRNLAELAGTIAPAKQAERVAEANGERIKLALEEELQAILAGGVLPPPNREAIPKLYITIDGSGVTTFSALGSLVEIGYKAKRHASLGTSHVRPPLPAPAGLQRQRADPGGETHTVAGRTKRPRSAWQS